MTDARIRKMTVADAPGVHAVELESFATPWTLTAFIAEMTQNPNAYYLVAETDEIIGFAGLWHIADEGHITNVAVKRTARGLGLGEGLLEELIEVARELGLRAMTLEVRVSNTPARTLYEKLGFLYAGTRKRYYQDNNEDAAIYWLELEGDET
ncbi:MULTISPECIES: ribosomal protein S18-alanine N-acetyltransferase [Exiguobacterium]|uniref:ribosomal protein S18-alanine N-acetyltransferase n=1 Tax=Exiguobacterium TaxID=33986 RepID=UPI000494288C|nr:MULTISPECIES: ribosomal protein S18-alanine N-acetyltransferase [Exiguobacterium]ASI36583.1 ribosomal-protein-alanine N-acetyltransferase RimI [Exiguobacterium sp. N4-1P]